MMVKTIVCDIDGVLIWHHPKDPSKDWRKNFLSGNLLSLWEGFQCSRHWERCLRNPDLNARSFFMNYLIDRGYAPGKDAHALIDVWLKHNNEVCEPALRKLEEWKKNGFECVLASNQDGMRKPYITRWLRKYGLDKLPIFFSCDVKAAKPDARYFKYIQTVLQRKPEELLLLDDREENVAAAKKAGWAAILIDKNCCQSSLKWDSIFLSPLP